MAKHFGMTELQKRIVDYADANPGLPQLQIALDLGTDQGTVSRTLSLYRPDRAKAHKGHSAKAFTLEIQEYKRQHMDMGVEAIAIHFGVSKHRVLKALRGFPKAAPGRKKRTTPKTYTIRECLRCGRDHKSTWAGDRICPKCRDSWCEDEPYSPTYEVAGYSWI